MTAPLRSLVAGSALLAAYAALTGSLHPGNLVLGGLVVAGILALRPRAPSPAPARQPAAVVRDALCFAAWVAGDVILCGLQVASIVLRPSMPIRSGIFAVKSRCRTESGQALSAHAITVTPGELVVEIGRDGTFYVHGLDVDASSETADANQAKRRALIEGPGASAGGEGG